MRSLSNTEGPANFQIVINLSIAASGIDGHLVSSTVLIVALQIVTLIVVVADGLSLISLESFLLLRLEFSDSISNNLLALLGLWGHHISDQSSIALVDKKLHGVLVVSYQCIVTVEEILHSTG